MIWMNYHIIFFCSSAVDEIWIRSTLTSLSRFKVKFCIIIYGSVSKEILSFYKNKGIKLIVVSKLSQVKKYSAKIFISASTNVERIFFSKKIKYWVHMPHSLVSLHGAYPNNAFDAYNTLFASTPYHATEFRKIAEKRNFSDINIFETGYGKLDVLHEKIPNSKYPFSNHHVLIAPSWGDGNILENIGFDLIEALLKKNYHVTLRPHSMFYLDKKKYLEPFLSIDHKNFEIENFSESNAMYKSDILITDFSGIAFEYYYVKNRKIIFVNTSAKIINEDFVSYDLPLFEAEYRKNFGLVVPCDLDATLEGVKKEYQRLLAPDYIFNIGKCGMIASHQIIDLLEK